MQNSGRFYEFIGDLKQKNNIVSVISKYITLDRKGKTYWACCPFHHEKTPSFAVNENEQYYHCFGCGKSGDAIKFIQEYERITYIEAVKILADNCGMKLPELENNAKDLEFMKLKAQCLKACSLAMQFYKDSLNSKNTLSLKAKEYLQKREISPQIENIFNIGLSPDWNGLVKFLESNDINKKTMKMAGLIDYNEYNSPYDFFGMRLVFPILNIYGEPIGFTARTLEDKPSFAKYKNSPQSIIFDKSKIVYNLDQIKNLSKQKNLDNIIICEGTIDVIAMVKAGFLNTVACMGTAITSFHAKEIKRFSDNCVLCLDGDSAGQNAMFKAIDVLLEAGLEVKVVVLKDNLDPDEFLKKYGKAELKNCIENSIDAIEFKLKLLASKFNLKDNFQKNKYIKEALNIISDLENNAQKEIYLKILSKIVNMSIDILRRDLSACSINANLKEENNNIEEVKLLSREEGSIKAVKFILSSIIHKKEYAKKALDRDIDFKNSNYQKLFDFVKNCYLQNKSYTISMLFDLFDVEENEDIKSIIDFDFSSISFEEAYFNQCLEKLSSIDLRKKQEELTNLFKTETDLDKRREIAKKLNEIAKELKTQNGEQKNV